MAMTRKRQTAAMRIGKHLSFSLARFSAMAEQPDEDFERNAQRERPSIGKRDDLIRRFIQTCAAACRGSGLEAGPRAVAPLGETVRPSRRIDRGTLGPRRAGSSSLNPGCANREVMPRRLHMHLSIRLVRVGTSRLRRSKLNFRGRRVS